MFTQNKLLGVIIGAVFMAAYTFGVYQGGYRKGLAESEITIANYEKEVVKLEAELQKKQVVTNVKIETKYVDRVKVIKDEVIKYVDRATNDVVSVGTLSAGWVYVHDSAARGVHAEAALSSDGEASGVKDTEALAVVVENYAICREDQERLRSLQEWVTETHDSVNN